ncbi:hypothetical protein L21SP3_01570 [Sedimentisphaera cyanobacteriorum]|uniref:LamG-like jellyroll fold domain-containing protein n=1 Tax=Sedimentisphaera cyanobacteriorum TaxID=1940790 RepID=A0A1Q2HQN1_9BACT|nr:LamG domain-containing protein [Sedimentisphaera cyanobacteriorum]AQQ09758.1 hypothetical protein L21SP3_01570 [Sedimentisphaera cyanobacteriorum]
MRLNIYSVIICFIGFSVQAGLLNHWEFNEGSGFTVSGSGRAESSGTLMQGNKKGTHGPSWHSDSERGSVLEFDGDDWVLTDSRGVQGGRERTVTVWFYLLSSKHRHTLLQYGGTGRGGEYFRLLVEDQRLRFEVANGNALALNSGDISLNCWHHAALVVDDFNGDGETRTPEVKFYFDGRQRAQTAGIDQRINTRIQGKDGYVHLGGAAQAGGSAPREAMVGYLGEVKIYDTALSEDEIIEDMEQKSVWGPRPANRQNVPVSIGSLSWLAGIHSKQQDVYFGNNYYDVSRASPSEPRGVYLESARLTGSGQIGRYKIDLPDEEIDLMPLRTYYWRVDQRNSDFSDSRWKGRVWKFTTQRLKAEPDRLRAHGHLPELTLNWKPPRDITEPLYEAVIAEDSDFRKIAEKADGLSKPLWKPEGGKLAIGRQYYFRVRAYDPEKPELEGVSDVLPLLYNSPRRVEYFDQYTEKSQLESFWKDGAGEPSNGASINLSFEADGQSMRLEYDTQIDYSEAQRTFANAQDWLKCEAEVLDFYFRGAPENSPAYVYIELEDSQGNKAKITCTENEKQVIESKWSPWTRVRKPLSEFASKGANLSNVSSVVIGLEAGSGQRGSGAIFVDSIGLDIKRSSKD